MRTEVILMIQRSLFGTVLMIRAAETAQLKVFQIPLFSVDGDPAVRRSICSQINIRPYFLIYL